MPIRGGWSTAIASWEQSGFVIASIDNNPSIDRDFEAAVQEQMPASLRTFMEVWTRADQGPWQALVASTTFGQEAGGMQRLASLDGLRSVVERANHAALIFARQGHWHSPERYGILLHVPPVDEQHVPIALLLHPPATLGAIAQAEQIIGNALPQSYKTLLQVANGISSDAREVTSVFGAGPQRADWHVVIHEDWLSCERIHEVAAGWRFFNGLYQEIKTDENVRAMISRRVLTGISVLW